MRKLIMIIVMVVLGVTCISCGEQGGSKNLTAGFDHEYVDRPEYKRFEKRYGFQFDNPELLDPALVYRAINAGQVDVVDVFTTDGRIEAYNLRVLEDDRNLFPPYDACVLSRKDVLKQHPGLREVLDRLAGAITPKAMQQMNYRYSEKAVDPAAVARQFLKNNGLLKTEGQPGAQDGDKSPVVVGSKHFGEQKILGNMLAILIEAHTPYTVKKRIGLQGTKVCFSALRNDEVDLYVEYTGTGLANILNEKYDPSQSKKDILNHVRQRFDKKWDLTWLDPLGFNNSYALTMREKHAEKLGIKKISDLKPYVK